MSKPSCIMGTDLPSALIFKPIDDLEHDTCIGTVKPTMADVWNLLQGCPRCGAESLANTGLEDYGNARCERERGMGFRCNRQAN
mmetsp:Transcript_30146/g.48362  ORF Transcript_30146/g.48362 Transcript_30146/m.48362 type:complete len:84 (-) Transcript_30146:8-259(-)